MASPGTAAVVRKVVTLGSSIWKACRGPAHTEGPSPSAMFHNDTCLPQDLVSLSNQWATALPSKIQIFSFIPWPEFKLRKKKYRGFFLFLFFEKEGEFKAGGMWHFFNSSGFSNCSGCLKSSRERCPGRPQWTPSITALDLLGNCEASLYFWL